MASCWLARWASPKTAETLETESCSCLCVCQQGEDGREEETTLAAGVLASVLTAPVIPSEPEPETAPEEEEEASPGSSEALKNKVGNGLPRKTVRHALDK